MRLPTQFRLRSLLAAIAVVAVVFSLGVRSARFGGLAQYHRGQEQFCSTVAFLTGHCGTGDGTDDLVTLVEKPGGRWEVRPVSAEAERLLEELGRRRSERKRAYERLAGYHARRVRLYRRAVALPWLSVPAESPPPPPE
jgi:hypothetical protein